MLIRVAALVPPVLENFALRELLLEDLICLLERVSQIGDADVQDGIRRQQRKYFAFIARAGCGDGLEFFAKLSKFRKQSKFVIEIVAPSNLLAYGDKADAHCGGDLVARVQNGFQPGVLDVDFSFNYGDAGAFGAGVHGKDRAGDGYHAIRSADIKVAGATMRGLDDDAALVEMDGGIATVCADG